MENSKFRIMQILYPDGFILIEPKNENLSCFNVNFDDYKDNQDGTIMLKANNPRWEIKLITKAELEKES